jgi:hypothetical protein
MAYTRAMCNSVVLPSGEVVVFGGVPISRSFSDTNAVLAVELWDPSSGLFSSLAPMQVPRNYHSIALLLKDGRVMTAGGGFCGSRCATNHLNSEIFTPPYLLSLSARPVIVSAPESAAPSSTFQVRISSTATALTFVLMRQAATTHAMGNEFRRIPLQSVPASGDGVFALTCPGATVALPGMYFLFALTSDGVPSVAVSVSVSQQPLVESKDVQSGVIAGSVVGVLVGLVLAALAFRWMHKKPSEDVDGVERSPSETTSEKLEFV